MRFSHRITDLVCPIDKLLSQTGFLFIFMKQITSMLHKLGSGLLPIITYCWSAIFVRESPCDRALLRTPKLPDTGRFKQYIKIYTHKYKLMPLRHSVGLR